MSAKLEYFFLNSFSNGYMHLSIITAADKHLAANLKLLELKYRYMPYLTIAGCILVRSMTNNNVTIGYT